MALSYVVRNAFQNFFRVQTKKQAAPAVPPDPYTSAVYQLAADRAASGRTGCAFTRQSHLPKNVEAVRHIRFRRHPQAGAVGERRHHLTQFFKLAQRFQVSADIPIRPPMRFCKLADADLRAEAVAQPLVFFFCPGLAGIGGNDGC